MSDHMHGQSGDHGASATLVDKPASPLGIPSWLWLTLLTFFLAFIIWISLRNTYHLLPVRVQHALQDLVDKLGLHGRIRLSDNHSYRSNGFANRGRYQSTQDGVNLGGSSSVTAVTIDLSDEDEEDDDDDDELPLATRLGGSGTTGIHGRSRRQQKLDRFVSLFSGKGGSQSASSYGNISNEGHGRGTSTEQEETILDLPNLQGSSQLNKLRKQPNTYSPSQTMLRTASNEGDAPSLPAQFALPYHSPKIKLPLSPTLDRSSPRSPLRSPSLSRTPSLVAIAEETSPSPRNSSDQPTHQVFGANGSTSSAHMSRSTSGSTDYRELPDWASARSFATQVPERLVGRD